MLWNSELEMDRWFDWKSQIRNRIQVPINFVLLYIKDCITIINVHYWSYHPENRAKTILPTMESRFWSALWIHTDRFHLDQVPCIPLSFSSNFCVPSLTSSLIPHLSGNHGGRCQRHTMIWEITKPINYLTIYPLPPNSSWNYECRCGQIFIKTVRSGKNTCILMV